MAIETGANAAKEICETLYGPPGGVAVAKEASYTLYAPQLPTGVLAAKEVSYTLYGLSGVAVAKEGAYTLYAPWVAPPVRYKRVPLNLDLATTTFDQANRLALYEVCRLCGFDVYIDTLGNMSALAAFLLSQFPELAGTNWKPPVTLTLDVWAEAVDPGWNILKSPDPTGANTQPFCGRHITIDPTVSVEWAGEYEIMEAQYTPFQSDASAATQNAAIAQPADQHAGIISLTLRSYDQRWLSMDTSMTPSYLNLPLPIREDELSFTGM
jgi:hypothetical protein